MSTSKKKRKSGKEAAGVASGGRQKSTTREMIETFVIAILVALFIRTFIVQAFKIPSGSMLPTLQIGDHLLVNKLLYGVRVPVVGTRLMGMYEPERGDVVVFVYPADRSKDFIKRVVGIPGDEIEIRQKQLYRNGQPVDRATEPYAQYGKTLKDGPRDNFGPKVVPEDHVFVMGDNRDHSLDSRFWGFVPYTDIKGKAFIIYFSWDADEVWPRVGRTFDLVE